MYFATALYSVLRPGDELLAVANRWALHVFLLCMSFRLLFVSRLALCTLRRILCNFLCNIHDNLCFHEAVYCVTDAVHQFVHDTIAFGDRLHDTVKKVSGVRGTFRHPTQAQTTLS